MGVAKERLEAAQSPSSSARVPTSFLSLFSYWSYKILFAFYKPGKQNKGTQDSRGMAGSSSSSSFASISSFDDVTVKAASNSVKFLCGYGGRILPRPPDGKLRYVGGQTRVLAVDRCVPYAELQARLKELCGWGSLSLRCQLPTEDLDVLVSVTSDEDLVHLFEEYDLASRDRLLPLKIRAFLFPLPSKPPPKPPIHPIAPSTYTPPLSTSKDKFSARAPPIPAVAHRYCVHRISSRPAGHHDSLIRVSPRQHQFPAHHGNHCQ